jgi:hypothetical protein
LLLRISRLMQSQAVPAKHTNDRIKETLIKSSD